MATTTAHTEQPSEGHKGAFPPFDPHTFPSQLVWLAITFIILYVVMSKLAIPQVGSIIENRQKRIADDLAQAQKAKEQADAAIAAYEKALADARGRAQAIATEMRETQAAAADTTRKQLETQLNAKLADAEKAIVATKQAAMSNVAGIAKDAAAAIVERLIGSAPADQDVTSAVAEALKR
ncbi:MAG TPA: F0F1 ATP synthase subunit B [Pseudolabrys sp.]|nr:F0F1 ATP synthase subunit B [Pseudolabrys sp.]